MPSRRAIRRISRSTTRRTRNARTRTVTALIPNERATSPAVSWGYVFEKLAAAASFTYQTTPVCFFGHTHVPLVFIRDSNVRGCTYSKFKVEPGRKYLVNVGSVGEPRDGDPKAAYVIYDLSEASIELRRVSYDAGRTEAKLREAGLPKRRQG